MHWFLVLKKPRAKICIHAFRCFSHKLKLAILYVACHFNCVILSSGKVCVNISRTTSWGMVYTLVSHAANVSSPWICVVQNETHGPNKQFIWKRRNVPDHEWHPVFCLHPSFEKQQARYAHLNSCLRTWATALWQCVGPGTCRFVLQQYCGSLLT